MLFQSGKSWIFFPISALLYVRKKNIKITSEFKTKLELGVELLENLKLPEWVHMILLTDGFYGPKKNFTPKILSKAIDVISRLRIDAAVYENLYLFSWGQIIESDKVRLAEFLKKNFAIDWINKAKIETIDNGKTIRIFTEKNSLSLKLNDKKTRVNLKIDDGRTYELVVMKENGKLDVYEKYVRNQKKTRDAQESMVKEFM